ncbi:hypothetical protein E8E14_001266 [Neopestalotiopsis sp. 37M]|nr:hypothetical protein E8E14_001266 [Neopestalotiopsis sp. 37M]
MAGDSAGASQTGASSSGNQAADSPRRTLDDVMRSPSTNPPGVVVLDSVHTEKSRKNSLNPREDLWLSSADGRYNSPIIPLQVGIYPDAQTFYVHKNILIKTDYFRKALCGSFKEAATQSISLPEEDPAIFHFIVAFLYEDKYVPIKPIASALVPDEKGKGLSGDDELMTSDSDSSGAGDDAASDSSSARSRRRRARRRRREDRHWEINRQKHPGAHRIGCGCRQCLAGGGPPCWHCLAPRIPPPPPPVIPIHPVAPNVVVVNDGRRVRNNRPRDRSGIASPQPPNHRNSSSGDRIQGEDLRSWLLTYELNLDVYVCANKFLLEDFKQAIARCCIDMLESAGADAAQTKVLELCSKLFEGLPESDPLLKMVFARVGFLQPLLWRQVPDETSAFLLAHPEISALILKETATRRELDHGVSQLPPMERPFLPPPFDSPYARPIAPMHHRARW